MCDSGEINRIPDVPNGPSMTSGLVPAVACRSPRARLTIAPDMERQPGHDNTSGQPTDGIWAHRKNACSVRFLDVRQAGCATQPDDGANRGIDPRRWSHQVLLAPSLGSRCEDSPADENQRMVALALHRYPVPNALLFHGILASSNMCIL